MHIKQCTILYYCDTANWIERIVIEEFQLNIYLGADLIGGMALTLEE